MRPDMQLAFELCLHGVGGAAHPDELLARLTGRQFDQWQIYIRHFVTPMRRADINSALLRQVLMFAHGFESAPKDYTDLIPQYGKQRKAPGDAELLAREKRRRGIK